MGIIGDSAKVLGEHLGILSEPGPKFAKSGHNSINLTSSSVDIELWCAYLLVSIGYAVKKGKSNE